MNVENVKKLEQMLRDFSPVRFDMTLNSVCISGVLCKHLGKPWDYMNGYSTVAEWCEISNDLSLPLCNPLSYAGKRMSRILDPDEHFYAYTFPVFSKDNAVKALELMRGGDDLPWDTIISQAEGGVLSLLPKEG